MYSKKHNQLLARVNFPLYTVQCLTERHILVAGGGGGAKTGIRNVIEIYELINNGSTCRAERVSHYETGNEAVMNCAVHNAGKYFLLFAGMEGNCQVYKIKHEIAETTSFIEEESVKKDDGTSVRKRRTTRQSTDSNSCQSELVFTITPLESFQTDFSEEPFQKLVRFSSAENLLITGGTDGHIRFWKHPKFNLIKDLEAHSDDVDDLDISPDGKMIVTVSRDGHGKVWSNKGTLITELDYELPAKSDGKYIFRSCRFGVTEHKDDLVLFTTLNPAVRKKPPLKSFLCKWDMKKFALQKAKSVGCDMLSAMAISDDGHFIALGTQNGGVRMYIAFSLQQIYYVDNAHGIFVTCLSFLQTSEECRRITGGHEASLLSVSVDNHIMIHHIPNRATMSLLTLITLFILTLFLVYVIMDYINL